MEVISQYSLVCMCVCVYVHNWLETPTMVFLDAFKHVWCRFVYFLLTCWLMDCVVYHHLLKQNNAVDGCDYLGGRLEFVLRRPRAGEFRMFDTLNS